MGIFSGTEVFKILCSIIKTKVVALWLGAVGVGLFGLFSNIIDTVCILTGLGLRQSGVREIACRRSDTSALHRIASQLRSWSLLSGLGGALLISIASPLLSQWCFGDTTHWWQFIMLAITILFNSLIGGEEAILQGTEQFRNIARAVMAGSAIGLLSSIPLFRWLDASLSVPLSFITYSIAIFVSLLICRQRDIPFSYAGRNDLREASSMVKLGGYMAMASFATSAGQMIFLTWLNRHTSTAEVGYYQAGYTLVMRYTSIIFTAAGLEFYPRMSANSSSPHRMSLFVSHEIGLLLKIMTPMALIFILCRKWIVQLLYTSDFLSILPFIAIAITCVILRSASTCMAFTIIAKGDGKTYFATETIDAIIGVLLNIWLYNIMGLTGVGIAMVIWCAIYLLIIGVIYLLRYRMRLNGKVLLLFALCAAISAAAAIAAMAA